MYKKVNKQISRKHLKTCVSTALEASILELQIMEDSIVYFYTPVNSPVLKDLKAFTRKKIKSFGKLINNKLTFLGTAQVEKQLINIEVKNLLDLQQSLNLNYPLEAINIKNKEHSFIHNSNALLTVFSPYVIKKKQIKNYSLVYKNLFMKFLLTSIHIK